MVAILAFPLGSRAASGLKVSRRSFGSASRPATVRPGKFVPGSKSAALSRLVHSFGRRAAQEMPVGCDPSMSWAGSCLIQGVVVACRDSSGRHSMMRPLTPTDIRAPFGRYSHALEVRGAARLVFCSGQLGVAPDDAVPDGVEAQSALCFDNIAAILREADLALSDIVRLNAYVTARAHMSGYMRVRDRYVGSPPPASTLVIVGGFTRPEFLVEVEATAAASS